MKTVGNIRRFLFNERLMYRPAMKLFTRKRRKTILENIQKTPAEKARQLYRSGDNCAQAVLQATCPGVSEELVEMAKVFGGGIDDSKCLCGAVAGGTMSLSLQGLGDTASELVAEFRAQFKTTCCKGLTARYEWLSKEHIQSCLELTAETADLVARLLETHKKADSLKCRTFCA